MSDEGVPTNPTSCVDVEWSVETDSTLGGSTQEWVLSDTPDDITTAPSGDECIYDNIGATLIVDAATGCLKGATAGISTTLPTFSIRTIRIRVNPGGKKRLKKKTS